MRKRRTMNRVVCIVILVASTLMGCSAPKHSNTLIFGTNTQFGIKASYDSATQQPALNIGYNRQELIWLPLIVNKAAMVQKDEPTTAITENPLFQATEGGENKDAYSAIASFGTTHSASYEPGKGPVASGQISQFIATGRAAIYLAQKGGDRLVSTSEATKQAAEAEAAQAKKDSVTISKALSDGLDKLCTPGTNALIPTKVTEFLAKNAGFKDLFADQASKDGVIANVSKPAQLGRMPLLVEALKAFTPNT